MLMKTPRSALACRITECSAASLIWHIVLRPFLDRQYRNFSLSPNINIPLVVPCFTPRLMAFALVGPYVQDVERGGPFSSFVAIRANTDGSLSS
jgi:hypothetical protein